MARLSSSLHRESPGNSAPDRTPRLPEPAVRALVGLAAVLAMVLAGCQQGSNPEAQRIDQLNLKIEQLEQRLNKLASERRAGSGSQAPPQPGGSSRSRCAPAPRTIACASTGPMAAPPTCPAPRSRPLSYAANPCAAKSCAANPCAANPCAANKCVADPFAADQACSSPEVRTGRAVLQFGCTGQRSRLVRLRAMPFSP